MPVDARRPHRSLLFVCTLAAALSARTAYADEFDTVNISLSTSLTYDSNLFRLSDSANTQAALGTTTRSDRISISSLVLRIDKSLSQQRFQAEVSETIYRYQNFSFLDFEALEYRGAWLWHVTPRISGTLGADRQKALVPFGDIRSAQQNLRVTDREYLTVDGQVMGPWHIVGGASHFAQKDSRAALSPEQSYDAVSAEAGIKYVSAPGTSLAVIQRSVHGTYSNGLDPATLFDDGFRDNQTEVVADWAATGKSTFRGRLTRIDRQHDHFPQRDFDALAGEANFLWSLTAKSRFNFLLRRDVTTWWETLASYRVSDTASLGYTWQVTAHAALLFQLDHIHRDYRGPVGVTTGALRSDDERNVQLGVNWNPLRSVALRAGVQHYRRASNFPGNDFDTNIANVSAAFTF